MDEILKRLDEIAKEAEALSKDLEAEDRGAKIKALAEERVKLIAQAEDEKALAELQKGAPEQPKAEEEEKPAEAPAEEAPAEEEKPAEAPAEEAPAEEEKASAPDLALAASAAPVDTTVPEDDEKSIRAAILASGNVAGTAPGSPLTGRDLGKIHAHAGGHRIKGNGRVRQIFASIEVPGAQDQKALSTRNSAIENTLLMARAKRPSEGGVQPITAAAAFCGPDDIILDIMHAGTDSRPVAGLFRSVPVRGRYVYMKPASLADVSPGVTVWEEADQEALDPGDDLTWKPSVDMSCRTETTVTPHAIVANTLIGVWQQLSAPEQEQDWIGALSRQYARTAERRLLDQVRTNSRVFSAGTQGRGLWDLVNILLAHSVSVTAASNRATLEGYTLVVPYGFGSALATDEKLRGFSQNKGLNRIKDLLREDYGVNLVESLEVDNTSDAAYSQAVGNLPAEGGVATAFDLAANAPAEYPIYLIDPDSFVMGSSEVVEAGYVRDADLVQQNLVRYFWEGMESLEKLSDAEAFTYVLTACPNGSASPLSDELACGLGL